MGTKTSQRLKSGLIEALQADFNAAQPAVGIKHVASAFDRSEAWASGMLRGNQPFPLAKAETWVQLTGGMHLAQWLADMAGYDLVNREIIHVEASLVRLVGETAEAVHAAAQALLTPPLTKPEVDTYRKEMTEAIATLRNLHTNLAEQLERARTEDHRAKTLAETQPRQG